MKLSSGGETVEVRVDGESAVLDGQRVVFHAVRAGERLEAIRVGEAVFRVRAERVGDRVFVWCAGAVHEVRRAAGRAASAGSAAGDLLGCDASFSGEGARVKKGDVVLILEAMKMEHAIRAPGDGTVARVLFGEGDLVEAGAVLAEIA